ncbi:hypothetical protein Scep_016873 [Stephania cephalantha]|uniref:SNF2 N-terminal domain-containing protein n=1 Tax=Stephania cephalantha TaxID=152367 RepID=A0AAP0NV43_9MAGN
MSNSFSSVYLNIVSHFTSSIEDIERVKDKVEEHWIETDSSETPPTVNELYLHLHTVNHDGMTFIDTRSERFYDRLQRRRQELTQATPDQSVDDEAVYLNVAAHFDHYRGLVASLLEIDYHCTNLDYALEMWRLLDPEAHLISLKQLMDRVLYNVLKKRFVMPRRLLMTGTPIQNNLSELWALMHFCAPLVFGKLEQFLFTFREAAGTSGFLHCY